MSATRLRQARELLGWPQAQLAELTGIPAAQLSQYESGRKHPSQDRLAAIGDALGFGAEWLRRPQIDGLPEGTVRFRKAAASTQRHSRQVRERLQVVYELVTELSAGVKLPEVTLPMLPAPANDTEVFAAAAACRAAMGLPASGPVKNLTRALERSGTIVIGLPAVLEGHDGASIWSEVMTRPVVGCRSGLPGDRRRFTVAHELGHLVCHSRSSPTAAVAEEQAHRFAAGFLVPPVDAYDDLAGPLTLTRLAGLKARWGVSIQALIQHAWRLGIIDDGRRRSLYQQLSARGWRTQEPVHVDEEIPRLFDQVLNLHYGAPAPLRQVAQRFGLPPHLVREFLGGPTPAEPGRVVALPR